MLSQYFSGTLAASILMSLPKQPRNDHPVSIQTYKKEQWTLVIANTGAKEPADCQRLYCNYWQTHLIPCLIQEFKGSLGEIHQWIPSLQTGMLWKYLRSIWTMLVPSYHGILGPKQDWILTSSSGTSQNILKHHIYTVTAKPSSKKLKRQFTLSSPPPLSKTLALAPSDQNPAPTSIQSKYCWQV